MESSELFSHTETQEPMPVPVQPIEPAGALVFSDRPGPQPRAEVPSSP